MRSCHLGLVNHIFNLFRQDFHLYQVACNTRGQRFLCQLGHLKLFAKCLVVEKRTNLSKTLEKCSIFTARKRSLGQGNVFNSCACPSFCSQEGGGCLPPDRDLPPERDPLDRDPPYWHLVAATEAGGTHPTGMHSCVLPIENICFQHWINLLFTLLIPY